MNRPDLRPNRARLPITLHPSRPKVALWMLPFVFLCFIALTPPYDSSTLIVLAFSVPGLSFCLAHFVPSLAYLQLTFEGFEYRYIFRRATRLRWTDVSEFQTAPGPGRYDGLRVTWSYVRRYKRLPSAHGCGYQITGGGGMLPDSYGVNALTLADLMKHLRQRYGRRQEDLDQEAEVFYERIFSQE